MPEADAPRWAPWATLAPALIGLALSSYLTVVHYTEPTALACPATATINCTKVTTSAQSSLLGVPVALIGAFYFLVMAMLFMPRAWRSRSAAVTSLRAGGAFAGMAMVLWLLYAEFVILHAICLWCTAVHVVTFALFVATMTATLWEGPLNARPATEDSEREELHEPSARVVDADV